MNHRRRSAFPPLAALSALAALALHCTGDSGDGPAAARAVSSGRQLQISDALHSGGTRGFYWLPPVVPRAAYRGDFLPDLDPRVRIDELRPDGTVARTLATFTRSTGPGGERVRVHLERGGHDPDDHDRDDDPSGYYYVRWSTHCAALSPAATYRIRALVPQAGGGLRELGFADVDVVRNAREVRAVDRDDFVPLVAGQTLRIKFRIDRPCVDGDGDGVYDARDNCPLTPNADQRDTDRDGRGDVCECDGVTCVPVDACHLAGACGGTGSCTRPVAPDGVACPLANATGACAAGSCRVASCAAGYADCDGAAGNGCERSTRTLSDCGACGVACAAAPHAAPTCAAGACALACAAGWADCDGSPANGCEQDVASDDANCGACGNACTEGRTCRSGACTASVCAAGRANCDGVEANGCEVTLAGDVSHCGACGNACAVPHGAPSCAAGVCGVAACAPGWTDCNAVAADGCEVNTAGDVSHCGACGRACAFPHAAPACLGGTCALGACAAGWADANGDAADGCEVDLSADPRHCGAVGNACAVAHGVPGCVGGACVVASCDAGFADCDGAVGDGCEVDTRVDASRCGACGNACRAGANAAAVCAGGLCGLQCAAGFADCNRFTSDGCEVNVATSARHCGACGNACADGRTCVAGACTAAVCAAGRANCDGVEASGCEVTLASDTRHCGACGNACSFPHAVPECNAGACGFTVCEAGYADCNGVQADGCEVSLASDAGHCGLCGNACATGLSCAAGACERVPFYVTTAADSGPGSLRQAILDLNASPRGGAIRFNIAPGGPQTIHLSATPLPEVTKPVVLDGATQPLTVGVVPITLRGGAEGEFVLRVRAPTSVVRALEITGVNALGLRMIDCDGGAVEAVSLTSTTGWQYGALGADSEGIRAERCDDFVVRGSAARDYGYGVNVRGGRNVSVIHNDVRGSGSGVGTGPGAIVLFEPWMPFLLVDNTFDGRSVHQVRVIGGEEVVAAASPGPGVHAVLDAAHGFGVASSVALTVRACQHARVDGLDVSWRASATPTGVGLLALCSRNTITGLRAENRAAGIWHNESSQGTTVRCGSFRGSTVGIRSTGVGDITVSDNAFSAAGTAIEYGGLDTAFVADGNWWGSPTGPSNLGGAGSGWSGPVTVTTWLSAPPACAP